MAIVVVDALHEADQKIGSGEGFRIDRSPSRILHIIVFLAQVSARVDEQLVYPLLEGGAVLQRKIR